ncbi:MAG: hypothetical protein H6652_01830 [Ardenticatenaceae bacterium]|nr:hypothetical protein [Ardenticatenaceae bacterium]
MKILKVSATLLAFFLLFALTACGGSTPPQATPTATTAAQTNQAVATSVVEIATDTPAPDEPTTAPTDVPTATTEAAPTEEAAVPATEDATAVPTEPVSYTITVDNPQPNQALTVAQEFTFSGSISPIPSQRLELELLAVGSQSDSETAFAFADVDAATGTWSVTTPLHPRRTGPATLHVRAAGVDATVPVTLRLPDDETAGAIVTVNQPLMGDVVVAGQTLLISGESRNLIDNKIQVGLFGCPADTDENLEASIEFEAGNGTWRAQIILPETAATNCDTARLRVTTGGLTSGDPSVTWASDQFLTLVPASDERANLFTVLEANQLRFNPGRATELVGTAVNAVDGQIEVALVRDGTVIATVTAVPDVFGYWEATLTPPADAQPGELQLRLSTGADDDYREWLLPTTLGS